MSWTNTQTVDVVFVVGKNGICKVLDRKRSTNVYALVQSKKLPKFSVNSTFVIVENMTISIWIKNIKIWIH